MEGKGEGEKRRMGEKWRGGGTEHEREEGEGAREEGEKEKEGREASVCGEGNPERGIS